MMRLCRLGASALCAGAMLAAGAGAAQQPEDLPDCEEVAMHVGPPISEMALMPTDDTAVWQDHAGFGLSCVWGTHAAVRAAQDAVLAPQDIAEVGIVLLEASFAPAAMTQEEAAMVGFSMDDPRVTAIDGWIFASPGTDLAEVLGGMPPQVNVGQKTVYFGASGAMFATPNALQSLTNDWAIASAVRVHALLP